MQLPEVFLIAPPLPERRQFGGFNELKFLAKVQPHFSLPLTHQPLRCNDQDASRHPTQFQFAENQARFNGLAQPHLIRQQVANAVAAHGTVQRIQLMR